MRVLILALALFIITAHAHAQPAPVLRSWQDVARYAGEQTVKINELQDKLRFQQGLIDEKEQKIVALKAHLAGQAVYMDDFICKWNRLLKQLAEATGPNPAVGPPVSKACDLVSEAPEWPDVP